MPRQARLDIAGQLYHVIARWNERRKIFCSNEDYEDFLSRLKEGLGKTDNKCLAWCLMPNHFHLLILRGTRPLAELMRRLMTGYVVNFNLRYRRAGHLFQNRYKAILCEAEEYLMELVAYIHLNPLRAKLVRSTEELEKYKWCGHGALTGRTKNNFMERDYILSHFGENAGKAVQKYKAFIEDRCGKYEHGEYSGGGLIKSMGGLNNVLNIRKSGAAEISDDRILGSGDFVGEVLKASEKNSQKLESIEDIRQEVEKITGISFSEIAGVSRERGIAKARALYCYLAKEKAGMTGVELMEELGISSSGISRLTARGISEKVRNVP